nr:Sir2 family NAD-dependent protein deacetylase [Candidatus Sigynarchaeota archaeon]
MQVVNLPEPDFKKRIAIAVQWIANAKHFTVLTGAGISTEAGIPDYVSVREIGEKPAKLTTPSALVKNWQKASPGPAHFALVNLQNVSVLKFLVSQNIDNLHIKSGIRPEILSEIHGNLMLERCTKCGKTISKFDERPPRCECGGIFRPSVVKDDEDPSDLEWNRVQVHARLADVLCAVGTSLSVEPVNSILPMAKRQGAKIIIINQEPTQMDNLADLRFFERAGEVLNAIVAGLLSSRK